MYNKSVAHVASRRGAHRTYLRIADHVGVSSVSRYQKASERVSCYVVSLADTLRRAKRAVAECRLARLSQSDKRGRPAMIATVRERQPDLYGDALHYVYAVTKWQGGNPTNVCDEHTDLKWFSINEMRQLTNIVDLDYPMFASIALTGRKV